MKDNLIAFWGLLGFKALLQKLGNNVVVYRSVADAIDTIKAYLEI
jgi:hypothetical protein